MQNQPWSAYNWYLGGYRARIDVNTDLPAGEVERHMGIHRTTERLLAEPFTPSQVRTWVTAR